MSIGYSVYLFYAHVVNFNELTNITHVNFKIPLKTLQKHIPSDAENLLL